MRAIWTLSVVALVLGLAARQATACKGCKPPTLVELAGQAEHVLAGKVLSADKHEHTVIAVSDVWKGTVGKTTTRTGCWRLFEKLGAKVIVLELPDRWTTRWSDECIGVYADTPANRATLSQRFGPSAAP